MKRFLDNPMHTKNDVPRPPGALVPTFVRGNQRESDGPRGSIWAQQDLIAEQSGLGPDDGEPGGLGQRPEPFEPARDDLEA
jgi:hypothetical protein